MPPENLSERMKRRATELGFQLCGICPAVTPTGTNRLDQWLEAGYAGQMHYLSNRREAYDHPQNVLDGARSIIMLGMHYSTSEPAPTRDGQGRVSRTLGEPPITTTSSATGSTSLPTTARLSPNATTRGVVDTAPLWNANSLNWLVWVGSGKTRSCCRKTPAAISFLPHCLPISN